MEDKKGENEQDVKVIELFTMDMDVMDTNLILSSKHTYIQ